MCLLCLSIVLLGSLMAGLVRVSRGPTPADRMLAAQLMGTTGVGILVLLSKSLSKPALLDIALVFALLAAVTAVAFVQRYSPRGTGAEP
jgi:multicomponent Na+:H+ antiporter subunit F